MSSVRAQVARLRRVAVAALSSYPIARGSLRFIAHGENTTFRHDGADGRHLVRVHRPERHGRGLDTETAVASELAWLDDLARHGDVRVPVPLHTEDGDPTVTVTVGDQTRTCSVLGWLPGRIHETSAHPVHLRRLGAAVARLHLHADRWPRPPWFRRIRWDHETFFGDVMVYGVTPARECWALLPVPVRDRFAEVAARLEPILAADPDIGLIHADPHLGNAVFGPEGVGVIDFDDCGNGPRLYDLAVALWELRDRPGYPDFRAALLAGYTVHREIDPTHLDDVIALRQVAFDLWYTGTAQVNPDFAARLDQVHRWSLDMLDLVLPHAD